MSFKIIAKVILLKKRYIMRLYIIVISIIASSWDLSDISLLTSAYWKLGEAWAIANDLLLLLLLCVFILVTCFLAGIIVDEFTDLAVLALALEFLWGLVLTSLQFAAYLLLGTLELFTWWRFLAAACRIWCFEAWMIVLIIGILFIAGPITLLILLLWLRIIRNATLLHLVLITILIFIESFPKLLLPLPLHISNSIFIQQIFYLACSFRVVCYCSWTSSLLLEITSLLFYLLLLLFVYLILVYVLFVVFWFSFWGMAFLYE